MTTEHLIAADSRITMADYSVKFANEVLGGLGAQSWGDKHGCRDLPGSNPGIEYQ